MGQFSRIYGPTTERDETESLLLPERPVVVSFYTGTTSHVSCTIGDTPNPPFVRRRRTCDPNGVNLTDRDPFSGTEKLGVWGVDV